MIVHFISDIHLGLGSHEVEKTKESTLLAFLDSLCDTSDELFIVGDLFDFWFEYKTVIPKGFHRTLTALQEFTDRGKSIHFLAGNHDFWMGDFFQTELGMNVYPEPFEIVRDGKRIFLHHGDGLASRDLGYRLIKPVLRNKFNIWLYRWLHPDIGVRLAKGSSKTSRQYTTNKHYGEEKGMLSLAREKINQGVDIVVMGHRHEPSVVPIDNGIYINLGDWITHNTYGVMRNGTITLEVWKQ